jgi:hypothetical protein
VKGVGFLVVAAILVSGGIADGQTSKARGRLAAELTASELSLRRADIDTTQIGACKRKSPDRFICRGRAFGEELLAYDSDFICTYRVTRCSFAVKVHRAGYSVLGRIHQLHCEREETAR